MCAISYSQKGFDDLCSSLNVRVVATQDTYFSYLESILFMKTIVFFVKRALKAGKSFSDVALEVSY